MATWPGPGPEWSMSILGNGLGNAQGLKGLEVWTEAWAAFFACATIPYIYIHIYIRPFMAWAESAPGFRKTNN